MLDAEGCLRVSRVFYFYFQGEAASLFPLHTASILSRSSCCEETGPGIYGEHKKVCAFPVTLQLEIYSAFDKHTELKKKKKIEKKEGVQFV